MKCCRCLSIEVLANLFLTKLGVCIHESLNANANLLLTKNPREAEVTPVHFTDKCVGGFPFSLRHGIYCVKLEGFGDLRTGIANNDFVVTALEFMNYSDRCIRVTMSGRQIDYVIILDRSVLLLQTLTQVESRNDFTQIGLSHEMFPIYFGLVKITSYNLRGR